MPKHVGGQGNPNAKLMVIGEAPGEVEDETGIPFAPNAPSGSTLDKVLLACGSSRDEVWITNVVKHRPPDNDLDRLSEIGHSIEEYIPELNREIQEIRPNVILAVGNLALKYTAGKDKITLWRGSILPCTVIPNCKVVPAIHPANFLTERVPFWHSKVFKFDVKRAIDESVDSELRIPNPHIQICKSSLQLYNYIEQYKDKPYFACDIETFGSIPVCVGIAFTKDSAMSIPLLRVNAEVEIGDHDLNEIWLILNRLFQTKKVIGQNFKFDHQKLLAPCGFDVRHVYADTMFLAHTIHPELPKKLEFLTSIYTRHPYYKDEGKEFNLKKHKLSRLLHYNGTDCIVTIECFERMMEICRAMGLEDFFFNQVMPLHQLYMDIDACGIAQDEKRKYELKLRYKALELYASDEFFNLSEYRCVYREEQEKIKKAEKKLDLEAEEKEKVINIASPKQLKEFLYGYMGFPIHQDTSEETLVGLLGNHCKMKENGIEVEDQIKARILENILDIRRFRITQSRLNAKVDYDGRMRTSYRCVGTENARSSTSILQPPVRPEQIGVAAQTITKHGDIGPEIRETYITDEGYVFLEADLSQAEARIVANLSGDENLLKLFDTADIHSTTASWIFKRPISKKDPGERFIGKESRHGGNYDMKKHRFMITVNTDARKFNILDPETGRVLKISERRADEILSIFHNMSPRIRGSFHKEIIQALKDSPTRTLQNPFGRQRQFLARWGQKLFQEAYAFIPQSTVRDHMIKVMIHLRKEYPDVRICLESHDSILALVKHDQVDGYASAVKEIMEQPIDFSRCSLPRKPLIIPAEVMIGEKNYRDLKKYNFEERVA